MEDRGKRENLPRRKGKRESGSPEIFTPNSLDIHTARTHARYETISRLSSAPQPSIADIADNVENITTMDIVDNADNVDVANIVTLWILQKFEMLQILCTLWILQIL